MPEIDGNRPFSHLLFGNIREMSAPFFDGRIGTIICRDYEKRENYVDDKEHVRCWYGYSPDPTTFVVVNFYDMNWSKDVSLIIETLDVTS